MLLVTKTYYDKLINITKECNHTIDNLNTELNMRLTVIIEKAYFTDFCFVYSIKKF